MLDADFEVICVDSDSNLCESATRLLRNSEKFTALCGDIMNDRIIDEVMQNLSNHRNLKWVLINNASLRLKTDVISETKKSWQRQMDVIIGAPFIWMQRFLDFAIKSKTSSGIVINVSSVASQFATLESPSYHAGKAGLESLTRLFAVQAPILGARMMVCSLRLGYILKEHNRNRFESIENRQYSREVMAYLPSTSIQTDNDVAKLVLAIVTTESFLLNGSVLELDSGANKQDQWFLSQKVLRGQDDFEK
jgi:NAD(P)-dependent dehydrogenase (short-subunit alcohol dehydrogenase family)